MSLNKETIFIDIDETSARTIEDWVYPVVNEQFWTNFTHDTTHNYRDVFSDIIHENWKPINIQKKIEIFYSAILQDKWKNLIRPIVWSVKKILELSEWYNIWMLTARHNALKDYTPEWVTHYYNWSVSKVLFSNCYHGWKIGKSEICKEEWVKIMIEDDMDYALESAKEWILVFLLKKPWNENRSEKHRNIKRIDSWNELKL
jgi:hypothetical protein